MKYIVILSVLIMIPNWAVALNRNPTHIHTNTPIELKSVSSNSFGIRYAAVCFLGAENCGDSGFDKTDDNMNIDTANQCQNEGYTYTASNCALPKFLEGQCVYNPAYYKECKQDIPRACSEAGYILVSQCPSGQKLKASPRCPWDNNYGICCKEICPNNSSLTCTGTEAGDDTCGYKCKQCCNSNCPAGTSLNNPGGCGGSTRDGCNTKTCYNPYVACSPPPPPPPPPNARIVLTAYCGPYRDGGDCEKNMYCNNGYYCKWEARCGTWCGGTYTGAYMGEYEESDSRCEQRTCPSNNLGY